MDINILIILLLMALILISSHRIYKRKMIFTCGGQCSQCNACPKTKMNGGDSFETYRS